MADSKVPVVQWFDADNTEQVKKWELGTIDAGNDPEKSEKTFLVWNNKGGADDVSDMTNVVVTTKDSTGAMDIPLVTEKWIEVKCDSTEETDFTPIGAFEDTEDDDKVKPVEHQIKATGAGAAVGEIKGLINDGEITEEDNFSKVTLRVAVPTTASAGNVDFLVRVVYEHV